MADELIKVGTANVLRCTCCCPESTHTGPDGHCIEPFCRDEPCTPVSESRRKRAEPLDESSIEERVARHLASVDWERRGSRFREDYLSLAREVIAIVNEREGVSDD